MVGLIPRYPKNATLCPQAVWKNHIGLKDVAVFRNQPYILLPSFTENEKLMNVLDSVVANKQQPYYQQLSRLALPEYMHAKVQVGDVIYARGKFFKYGEGLDCKTVFIKKDDCSLFKISLLNRDIYLVSKKHLLDKTSFMIKCLFSPKEISVVEVVRGKVREGGCFWNETYRFHIPNSEELTCLCTMLDFQPIS